MLHLAKLNVLKEPANRCSIDATVPVRAGIMDADGRRGRQAAGRNAQPLIHEKLAEAKALNGRRQPRHLREALVAVGADRDNALDATRPERRDEGVPVGGAGRTASRVADDVAAASDAHAVDHAAFCEEAEHRLGKLPRVAGQRAARPEQ
jgi:hypothetical protein